MVDKAHGAVARREYWQTDDIAWLEQGKAWAGLASIVMTKHTMAWGGDTMTEMRYFISAAGNRAGSGPGNPWSLDGEKLPLAS